MEKQVNELPITLRLLLCRRRLPMPTSFTTVRIVPQIAPTAFELKAFRIFLFKAWITVRFIDSEEIVVHKQIGLVVRIRLL